MSGKGTGFVPTDVDWISDSPTHPWYQFLVILVPTVEVVRYFGLRQRANIASHVGVIADNSALIVRLIGKFVAIAGGSGPYPVISKSFSVVRVGFSLDDNMVALA